MKATEVKSEQDILNFLEGCLNDFETGLSSKNETMQNLVELIVHLNKLKA